MGSTALAEPQQKEPGAEREASHDEGDYPAANRLALSPTPGHGTAKQFKKNLPSTGKPHSSTAQLWYNRIYLQVSLSKHAEANTNSGTLCGCCSQP